MTMTDESMTSEYDRLMSKIETRDREIERLNRVVGVMDGQIAIYRKELARLESLLGGSPPHNTGLAQGCDVTL